MCRPARKVQEREKVQSPVTRQKRGRVLRRARAGMPGYRHYCDLVAVTGAVTPESAATATDAAGWAFG